MWYLISFTVGLLLLKLTLLNWVIAWWLVFYPLWATLVFVGIRCSVLSYYRCFHRVNLLSTPTRKYK